MVLLSALMITGCGSGDSAEASLTKEQYQKKANLICNDASNEQLELASKYLAKHPGAEEADLVVPAGIPPLEKELEELKALGVPEGFELEVEAFIEAYEAGLEGLKEEPEAALSEQDQDNPFDEANDLGQKYKLGDCSDHP